jgi:hypothetical protein
MNIYKITFVLIALIGIGLIAKGQGIPLGEKILASTSPLKKDIDPEVFKVYMQTELIPAWNRSSTGTTMYLLKADRGDRNGEYLPICISPDKEAPGVSENGSPFSDKSVTSLKGSLSKKPSAFLENPDAYTEYHLIGGDRVSPLPTVEILGIHYLKVKPELAKDFERLVIEKLHPSVGKLVHDMNLLYYKAVDGQDKGSFITIYAIESIAARERFWPTGGQEQDIVKQLFGSHKDLAKELGSYMIEDSYLKPESGGGAAYFESLEWTDFVVIKSK